MKLSAQQIANLVQGRLGGDGDALITNAAGLSEAGPHDLSFVRDSNNPKVLKLLKETKAGAVLVPEGLEIEGKTSIKVRNPMAAFSAVLQILSDEKNKLNNRGIHPSAFIAPGATLGKNVHIGPFSVVEDGACVGDNTTLMAQVYIGRHSMIGNDNIFYPSVVIREEVKIGNRCIIHAGAVIGSDGYGYYFANNRHNKIPQIGTVILEDDVEIGSCTTIDRATTGQTVIKTGSKIDNLVQIAHNVEVGPYALLVAQVGIAGSSKIGRGAVLAGQVGVADHVFVGDGVQVGAQSGIKDDAPAGSVLFGSPAQPIQDSLRQFSLIRRLPELFKIVKGLKDKGGIHD